MTREEWLESLRKSGWSDADISKARFAWNAAERATREDCAGICNEFAKEAMKNGQSGEWSASAVVCAAKIRESIK